MVHCLGSHPSTWGTGSMLRSAHISVGLPLQRDTSKTDLKDDA